jgi:hypothetical protein
VITVIAATDAFILQPDALTSLWAVGLIPEAF